MPIECDKIQECFSSLLEKEVTPPEEKKVRDHLASCSDCRKELERFEKTMQWLHSVEEVEAPEGLLPEILKTLEEPVREPSGREGDKAEGWRSLRSLKLPIQAVAMVTVLFIAFYLTQMLPTDKSAFFDLKEVEQARAPQSDERGEKSTVPTETEKEKRIAQPSSETGPPEGPQRGRAVGAEQTKQEGEPLAKETGEFREAPVLPSKSDTALGVKSTEREGVETPPPAAARPMVAKEMAGKPMVREMGGPLEAKPPEEIVLRVTDRERTLSEIRRLVKDVQGEILKTEENALHASIPAGLFQKFKKELTDLDRQGKTDSISYRKEQGDTVSETPVMKEVEKKVRARASSAETSGKEDRVSVRILLLEE